MKCGRHRAGQLRARAVGAETHGALCKDHAVLTGRGQGRQLRRLPRSPQSSPYRTKACSPRGRSRKHRWRPRLEGEAGAAETLCRSWGGTLRQRPPTPGRGGTPRKPRPEVQGHRDWGPNPAAENPSAPILVPQPSPGQSQLSSPGSKGQAYQESPRIRRLREVLCSPTLMTVLPSLRSPGWLPPGQLPLCWLHFASWIIRCWEAFHCQSIHQFFSVLSNLSWTCMDKSWCGQVLPFKSLG